QRAKAAHGVWDFRGGPDAELLQRREPLGVALDSPHSAIRLNTTRPARCAGASQMELEQEFASRLVSASHLPAGTDQAGSGTADGRDNLCGSLQERGTYVVVLTTYINDATDHYFTLGIVELPEVRAAAADLAGIPEAVRAAAAKRTGMAPDVFTIVRDY
ncbi:MAG TPA: hypothetical protein VGE95_03195, partial [Arthrobacter sp.]